MMSECFSQRARVEDAGLSVSNISRLRAHRRAILRYALLAMFALVATAFAGPAQAQVAATKNVCLGQPSDYTDPATCPLAAEVPVGQPIFYVIRVANPYGSPVQTVTLTDNYPVGFLPATGQTYCVNKLNQPVALSGSAIGSFTLALDDIVTCYVPGKFDANSIGQHTNTVYVKDETGTLPQQASVSTNVVADTPLGVDLQIVKTVLPLSATVTSAPYTVHYKIVITNNGLNAVDIGHWFVLHDNMRLMPNSIPLFVTLSNFQCSKSTGVSDCLDTVTPGPTMLSSGQTLIGTMAPHPMFDWGFAPNVLGTISAGGTITVTFDALIAKVPALTCYKALNSDGLSNESFFTLWNKDGTVASDSNHANNTSSTNLTVVTGNTIPNATCGDGQLTITKTQVTAQPSGGMPWGTSVTYLITIKNTSAPQQSIVIPAQQLQDWVVEGLGTPPFRRRFVGMGCVAPAAICTAFNSAGGGNPPPLVGTPPGSFGYSYYGQAALSWRTKLGNAVTLGTLPSNNAITIKITFAYENPDCTTVPAVNPHPIDNVAVVHYSATALGAPLGSILVPYTQTATVTTKMEPQKTCDFVVTKTLGAGGPLLHFGSPLTYVVTFTNNEPGPNGNGRDIGTVIDVARITAPSFATAQAYATSLPFTSLWNCGATVPGSVTGFAATGSITTGSVVATSLPNQGSPTVNLRQNPSVPLHFGQGATLTCKIQITVNRPSFNNPHCTTPTANFENLALMDVTSPYNPNVGFPPTAFPYTYSSIPASNPPAQKVNWATYRLPLPKCFSMEVNKEAWIEDTGHPNITPAWTFMGGPPVHYGITVTNNADSTLSGTLLFNSWQGVIVDDTFQPPYATTIVAQGAALCGPPLGIWCQPTPPPLNPLTRVGVKNLLAHTSGTWLLVAQSPPAGPIPQGGQFLTNCTSTGPTGILAGPDWYSNYQPKSHPPDNPQYRCVYVPVLPTTTLDISKTFIDLTGGVSSAITFSMTVTCGPTYHIPVTMPQLSATPNGPTVTTTVKNIPAVSGEQCTVTETLPAVPIVATKACAHKFGPNFIAVWDDPPTYSPSQTVNINTPPAATKVTVTNTLRCVQQVDVAIEKTVNPSTVSAGQPVEFDIVVANNGAAIVNPAVIVVNDVLPVGLTFVNFNGTLATDWSCTAGTPTSAGTPIACTYLAMPLAAGATTSQIRIHAIAKEAGEYKNCSNVHVDGGQMIGNGPTESCADLTVTEETGCCCDTWLTQCVLPLEFIDHCLTLEELLFFTIIVLLLIILWVVFCLLGLVKSVKNGPGSGPST